ncbi:MAG: hypothetical protein ACRERV_04835 [Methylococcales bacterium]
MRIYSIQVEVAAFPELNAAREILLKESGFIDLGLFVEEQAEGVLDGEAPASRLNQNETIAASETLDE